MVHPKRVPALLGALVLVAGLGTLVGCGSDDKSGVTTTADKLSADSGIASPTASTDDASAGADNAGSAATDAPAVTGATDGLPEGFPSDDVPLLNEQVLTGSAGGPDGEFAWSVVLQSSRAVSEVSAEVHKEFTNAGYTAGPGNDLGDLSIMQFTGPKYEVGVTAARSEGRVVITYVVRDLS